jgi:hypothetical protein
MSANSCRYGGSQRAAVGLAMGRELVIESMPLYTHLERINKGWPR